MTKTTKNMADHIIQWAGRDHYDESFKGPNARERYVLSHPAEFSQHLPEYQTDAEDTIYVSEEEVEETTVLELTG